MVVLPASTVVALYSVSMLIIYQYDQFRTGRYVVVQVEVLSPPRQGRSVLGKAIIVSNVAKIKGLFQEIRLFIIYLQLTSLVRIKYRVSLKKRDLV